MAEFVWGGYRLEVDVEATRAYYDSHPGPWITCTCDGCRNFMLAVKTLPQAVRDFFDALGLDPEKPGSCVTIRERGAAPQRRRMVPSGGTDFGR